MRQFMTWLTRTETRGKTNTATTHVVLSLAPGQKREIYKHLINSFFITSSTHILSSITMSRLSLIAALLASSSANAFTSKLNRELLHHGNFSSALSGYRYYIPLCHPYSHGSVSLFLKTVGRTWQARCLPLSFMVCLHPFVLYYYSLAPAQTTAPFASRGILKMADDESPAVGSVERGVSIDQDGKSNVWAIEPKSKFSFAIFCWLMFCCPKSWNGPFRPLSICCFFDISSGEIGLVFTLY